MVAADAIMCLLPSLICLFSPKEGLNVQIKYFFFQLSQRGGGLKKLRKEILICVRRAEYLEKMEREVLDSV